MQLMRRMGTLYLFLLLLVSVSSQAAEKTLLNVNVTSEGMNLSFTEAQLLALPQHDIYTSLPWTETKHTYSGPYLDDVLRMAQADGPWVCFEALDKYKVTLDYGLIKDFKPIIALKRDGKSLTVRTKGPLWLILPVDDHATLNAALYNDFMVWHLIKISVHDKEPK